jgi:hypothetical protein
MDAQVSSVGGKYNGVADVLIRVEGQREDLSR